MLYAVSSLGDLYVFLNSDKINLYVENEGPDEKEDDNVAEVIEEKENML